mmetsp:Transcript_80369/g.167395  ORF Transcript_80369/g.167395 Transcript_80369/m.167395 type:complete len:223 (-) Transcript_80369:375-1043(-)
MEWKAPSSLISSIHCFCAIVLTTVAVSQSSRLVVRVQLPVPNKPIRPELLGSCIQRFLQVLRLLKSSFLPRSIQQRLPLLLDIPFAFLNQRFRAMNGLTHRELDGADGIFCRQELRTDGIEGLVVSGHMLLLLLLLLLRTSCRFMCLSLVRVLSSLVVNTAAIVAREGRRQRCHIALQLKRGRASRAKGRCWRGGCNRNGEVGRFRKLWRLTDSSRDGTVWK